MNYICTECDKIFSRHPMTILNEEIKVKELRALELLDSIEFEANYQNTLEDTISDSIDKEYAETKSVDLSNETKRKRKRDEILSREQSYNESKNTMRSNKKLIKQIEIEVSYMKRKLRLWEVLTNEN